MCAGHSKLKCRCWHSDLAFEDFGGDNLRPSDLVISIQWGAFLRSIPPTHCVGDMVHCRCRIVNAIFKRVCSDGRISWARALPPLLRSVVQPVMHAAAHIPSEIRDAQRPTKDGNFDLAGGRWFARDQTKHAKVVQLIQRHVGPQERVAVGGRSIPLHALIHRMLLSLWYMEKCWSNKIGLTTKEVKSYRRAVGQFAIDWCALQWQPTVWVHWTCVHSQWLAAEKHNFYIFFRHPHRKAECGVQDGHPPFILGYKILVLGQLLGQPPLHCDRQPCGAEPGHHPPAEPLESGGRELLWDLRLKVHLEMSLHGHSQDVTWVVDGRFAFEILGSPPSIPGFARPPARGRAFPLAGGDQRLLMIGHGVWLEPAE